MRLDVYLITHGVYKSRTRATAAIAAGCVRVNGAVIRKNAFSVPDGAAVECMPDPLPYVSRGGLKLEGALTRFGVSVQGLRCVDVGASTGGFTHVLLERGAQEVTCVDVGHGQLDPALCADPRVTGLEGTDVRTFYPDRPFAFLCMDVSFISVTRLIGDVSRLLLPGAQAVILVKPQFEVGRAQIGKHGIVRSREAAERKVSEIADLFEQSGLAVRGRMVSPIPGGDGNTEYCLLLQKV